MKKITWGHFPITVLISSKGFQQRTMASGYELSRNSIFGLKVSKYCARTYTYFFTSAKVVFHRHLFVR